MVDLSIAMLNFQRVPHCSIFHRRHLFPTWNGKCNSCGSGNAKAKIWDATITSLPKTMPGMSCQNDSSLKRNKHQKNIRISNSLVIVFSFVKIVFCLFHVFLFFVLLHFLRDLPFFSGFSPSHPSWRNKNMFRSMPCK